MTNSLYQRHIISIDDLSVADINLLINTTKQLKAKPPGQVLSGKVLANCFFEASTRTRLSFASAAHRLGLGEIGFADANSTSAKQKGESLYDSMKVIAQYADALVIRHPIEGAARLAAEASRIPVINAGDGANQHPTQTLLDLYTIEECQNRLQDIRIAFVGDLKYGRTVHSLAQACAHYNMRFYFVSTEGLTMPAYLCEQFKRRGIKFSFHESINDIIDKVDILYMTRLQKERFLSDEHQQLQQACQLNLDLLKKAKDNLRIMHPLPRVDEVDHRIDETPYAYYFQQAENGLHVRQALLGLLLQEDFMR